MWRDITMRPCPHGTAGAARPFPNPDASGALPAAPAEAEAGAGAKPKAKSAKGDAKQGKGRGKQQGEGKADSGSAEQGSGPAHPRTWPVLFKMPGGAEWKLQPKMELIPAPSTAGAVAKEQEKQKVDKACHVLHRVQALPTAPIWEEVDPQACAASGQLLKDLKGLPKYEHCFQGF